MFDGPGVGSKWVEIFCFVLPAAVFKDKLEKNFKNVFCYVTFPVNHLATLKDQWDRCKTNTQGSSLATRAWLRFSQPLN